jgi:undecaprenyl phosphate N,N'-diacetylbacillosamine 1-phosphate transferase
VYQSFFKRFFDILFSLAGLVIASPVLVVITIWLFFANKGKPFFFQERPGKDERIFKVVKFKTMNDKRNSKGQLLPDGQRLTRIGGFIRATSIDELPQLWNVLKGDMSLIGPRPLLVNYLPYYTDKEKFRHSVRPGISGLAQVSGRNNLSWDERLKLDVTYVEQLSLVLDLRIILKTIKNVFLRKDIAVIPGSTYKPLNEERAVK